MQWLTAIMVGLVEGAFRGVLAADAFHLLEGLVQRGWRRLVSSRALSEAEIAASREVHRAGLIPYRQVTVSDGSPFCRLSRGRAVCTMNIIHFPGQERDLPLAVHELTHAAQYRHVGAIYMLQALHAQLLGGGYDYGDLTRARQAGVRYRNLNREQQAQVAEDYYRCLHGLAARFGGTVEALQPYIDDMNRGEF
jgi:hypothetical protein